jgi:hypothetical protein
MNKIGTDPVDDRIRFYCMGHDTKQPVVTLHERRWAFCRGGYFDAQDGHDWVAIEPTSVHHVKPPADAPPLGSTRTA